MEPLKLGFNYTDDPWVLAQKFIWKHGISQMFLDQISQFIIENQKQAGVTPVTSSSFSDPYSGANRYIPGSSGAPSNPPHIPVSQVDPLSGAGRYIPGSSSAPTSVSAYISIPPDPPITRFSGYAPAPLTSLPLPPDSSHPRHIPSNLPAHYTRKPRETPNNPLPPAPFSPADNKFYPKRAFQLFTAKEAAKIMDKLAALASDGSISPDSLEDIRIVLTTDEFQPQKLHSLLTPLYWPPDKSFIALDIIRIALLDPCGNKYYSEEEGEGLLHFLLYTLPSGGETACKYLVLYMNTLNNLFAHRPGQYLMEHTFDQTIPRLKQLLHHHTAPKVQLGISTICLNYCLIATAIKNDQLFSLCGSLIRDLFFSAKNDEAQFRTLVALGHLTTLAPHGIMEVITNPGVVTVVESLVAMYSVPKISECANYLQVLLKSKQK